MDDNVPTSAGLSSFNLLDERKLFGALGLRSGMTLLDFGCGVGNYAIAAAPHVGENGCIYAVDLWDEGIETLEVRTSIAGIGNIQASICGAGDLLPMDDQIVDLCLLGTVMHILTQEKLAAKALREIQRVLHPDGRVAVVEFYKKEGPPGPPLTWRLSPSELQEIMHDCGFTALGTVEVGPHNYLSLFKRSL